MDKAEDKKKKSSLCIEHKGMKAHTVHLSYSHGHIRLPREAKLKIYSRIHAEYLIALSIRNK